MSRVRIAIKTFSASVVFEVGFTTAAFWDIYNSLIDRMSDDTPSERRGQSELQQKHD
jgi:hypothetical protein